jgi:SAM-dependent methyltransferase
MTVPICRTCEYAAVRRVGRLPVTNNFAGRQLDGGLPAANIWRCPRCGFVFRHPLLSPAHYEALYEAGSLGLWDGVAAREDFRLIRDRLASLDGQVIDALDVGCYTGQLLLSFPKSLRLYGVEPNREAAEVSRSKGVEIIAGTVEGLENVDRRFDVITACDVIEHVANPLTFLDQLARKLKAEGRLFVTTGNCDSWFWRFAGARFWYSYFAEHISFIGERWLRTMPGRIGLELVDFRRFNYLGGNLRVSRLAAASLYRFSPSLYKSLRNVMLPPTTDLIPVGCGATRDHMLFVLRHAGSGTAGELAALPANINIA